MKHPFQLERGGRQWFLVKHPGIRQKLKAGTITEAQARATPWYIRLEKSPDTGKSALLKVGDNEQLGLAIEAAKLHLLKAREGANPYKQYKDAVTYRKSLTLSKLLAAWQAIGCPDNHGRPRAGDALETLTRNIRNLLAFPWADKVPGTITDADRDDYHAHRLTTVTRGTGSRTTELELVTLNSALQWAWRRGDLQELPRGLKTSYRDPSAIEHARDVMPSSAEELHAIARHLFNRPATAVYGWATLLGAFTGLRLGELQALRASPQRVGVHVEPGWYDDRCLVVHRSKRRGGKPVQDEFALNDTTRAQVRPLLERIRHWHAAFKQNPATPGRKHSRRIDLEALLPMTPDSLTKQLQDCAAELKLPERQAHGLRAYYVSARLAAGIAPAQVAGEVGHLGSGDHLVRTVYGDKPPQWRGLENVYTWLPTAADKLPAWQTLEPAANIIKLCSGAEHAPWISPA